MKKFILLTVLICGFLAINAQKTTGGNYTYIAQRYEWLAGIFQALGLPAGSGPAAFRTGQEQRAGAVYYDSLGADAGFYIYTGIAWVLQGSPAAVELPDELIQPGRVIYSGTGLKFYITPSIARFSGVIYGTTYDSVTLSPSDPDDPRKDVIYVATTGIEVLTGTPAGPAAEPQLSAGQIKLTVVDVPALATTPALTQNFVYDENTESVVTAGGSSPPTIDADNTTNPYHLTKAVNVTSLVNDGTVIFTLPSTVDLNAFHGLVVFIKLKAPMTGLKSIAVSFDNGTNRVSNEITLAINKSSTDWQGAGLSITDFSFTNTFIDKVRIRYIGSGSAFTGFYLDYIYLQSGLIQSGSPTSMAMAPIDSKPANPNGGTIANGLLNLNNVTNEYSGLMTSALKAKLDSLRWKYFLENSPYGAPLFRQLDDSTAVGRGITGIGGIVVTYDDDTITVDGSGIAGGSQNLQSVTDVGNITTTDLTVGNTDQNPLATIFNLDNAGALSLRATDSSFYSYLRQAALLAPQYIWLPAGSGNDTIAYLADVRAAGGGGISLTTTGSSGVATLVGSVLNVPDYSSGSSIWNGVVIGTTFSATGTTINSGAVQWTFTGSSPATFTLPARTSSVNQFYTIKNIGSADLTVAAAGTDDIYTTSSVASITVVPGGSVMVTGAANGTADLWTALFYSTSSGGGGSSIPVVATYADLDTIATAQAAIINNSVYGGLFVVDASVTMTSTNYGVIRSGGTQKWRRVYSGPLFIEWWNPSVTKAANSSVEVQAAIDYANFINGGLAAKGSSIFLIDSLIFHLQDNFRFNANGATFVLSASENAAYAIKISNMQESVFENMTLIGTGDTSSTVVAGEDRLIYVSTQSGRVTIQNSTFRQFTENAIVVDTSAGLAPVGQGVRILNCNFLEQDYDAGSTNQYAVLFKERGEYSTLDGSYASDIVGLVRSQDAANLMISNNVVEQTAGQTSSVDYTRAVIYIDSVIANNGGKVMIYNNRINHHGKFHIPLIIMGNVSGSVDNPAFSSEVVGNHFLSNGGNRPQIYIKNQHGISIGFNNIRAGTNSGPAVIIEGSEQFSMVANKMFDATYGAKIDSSSTGYMSANQYFDILTANVQILNGSVILDPTDTLTYNFNVTAAGSTGPASYDPVTKTLNVPEYASAAADAGKLTFMTSQANINTLTQVGCTAALTAATTTAVPVTNTNYFTSQPRVTYASSSVAGNSVSLRSTQGLVIRSGGFKVTMKFGIQATGTASRGAFGVSTNNAAFANADPSALTNFIGVIYDAGQTNLRLAHNDAAGAATTIDLGANFPTNTSATDYFEVVLSQGYGASSMNYIVKRYNSTGVLNETNGTVSTELPVTTTVMYPQYWINNGANAEVVSMAFSQLYVINY